MSWTPVLTPPSDDRGSHTGGRRVDVWPQHHARNRLAEMGPGTPRRAGVRYETCPTPVRLSASARTMRAVTAAVPHRLLQAGALLAATMLVSCDRRETTAPTAPTASTASIQPAAVATAGVAAKLSFTGNPRNAAAGSAIAPAVQVMALDGLGNPVLDFAGDVTMAIATGTGASGATLAGSATVTAVGGVATFTTLSIATPGSSYRLTAAATGLTPATSGSFFIAGPATTLAFTVQPPTTSGVGIALAPAVRVTALDALGNRALGFASAVTMAITPGTGTGGATLAGTTVVTAATGSASFYTLPLGRTGTAYTLTPPATGL